MRISDWSSDVCSSDLMLEAASHSNRFLDRPIRAMDRDTDVGQSLIELRTTIERLDPSANGKLLSKRGFLDKIFGSKINNYFAQYRSAQTHIGAIGRASCRERVCHYV